MKILHICKIKQTGLYVTESLRAYGEVHAMPCANRKGHEAIVRFLKTKKPDLLLFHKGGFGFEGIISAAKAVKSLKICWYYDYIWGRYKDRQKSIVSQKLNQADLFFATDGGHDKEWHKLLGKKRILLRQGIYGKHHRRLNDQEANAFTLPIQDCVDIVFIGQIYSKYRKELSAKLKKRYGKRYAVVGDTGCPQVRDLALNALLRRVKVVVGESVPSPFYWSNRVYEVTGRGGFLIHTNVAGLAAEFKPGEEILLYDRKDWSSLFAAIDRALDDREWRESVTEAGCDRCPTYDDRVSCMMKMIRKRI